MGIQRKKKPISYLANPISVSRNHVRDSLRKSGLSFGPSSTGPALRFSGMLHSPPHYWVYKALRRPPFYSRG